MTPGILVALSNLRVDVELRHEIGILLLAGLYVLPLVVPDDPTWILRISGLITVLYLMMFAMSWDVVSGYTGEISFGHAFFFAIGGYTTAILNVDYGVTPLLSIFVALLLSTVGSLLIGFPALRLKGPYLSLVTLIVPIILLQIFTIFRGTFRGTEGFTESPTNIVGTTPDAVITVTDFETMVIGDYYLALVGMTVILAALLVVTRSDAGQIFTAIREDEASLEAAGISTAKFKIYAFAISGAAGGFAGAMFVHSTVGHPQPSQLLELQVSINVIIMSVIGGMGTIVGAIVGAVFFGVVNAVLDGTDLVVPLIDAPINQLFPIPLLVVTVLVLIFVPRGILGVAITAGTRLVGGVNRRRSIRVPDGGRTEPEPSPLEQTIAKYRRELQDDLHRIKRIREQTPFRFRSGGDDDD